MIAHWVIVYERDMPRVGHNTEKGSIDAIGDRSLNLEVQNFTLKTTRLHEPMKLFTLWKSLACYCRLGHGC